MDQIRRDLLLAPLLAALPFALAGTAEASRLNRTQTIVLPPADMTWIPDKNLPERSLDTCPLYGSPTAPGLYYTLVRWWPGYMSAPHTDSTDRLCIVVSGTWYCNSGTDFDPAACVPVEPGSFVRRVAGTPHYDGVLGRHEVPSVIAICGIGPVVSTLIDPAKPAWREA